MSTGLFALPIEQQLSPSISLRTQDQLPIVVIDHTTCQAAITLQGAHLVAWQPQGEQPVIWLSEQALFKPGKAIRGGIPICWPWFGKAAQPAHGFARNLPWQLTDYHEDQQQVKLIFSLEDSDATRQIWPHPFKLTACFTLSNACLVELESSGDYQVTAALHSYFTIGDINQIAILGLGDDYYDSVQNKKQTMLQQPLTFSGEVDRVYSAANPINQIVDPVLKRTIEVTHQHNSDVVAWNPGPDLSIAMADMADDGYKTMVCVETACVNQPITVTQQQAGKLSVNIQIKSN